MARIVRSTISPSTLRTEGDLGEDVIDEHISHFCNLEVGRFSIGIGVGNGVLSAVHPRHVRFEVRVSRHSGLQERGLQRQSSSSCAPLRRSGAGQAHAQYSK
eukprot:2274244-Pleurochrysis_carterae.AAC.1